MGQFTSIMRMEWGRDSVLPNIAIFHLLLTTTMKSAKTPAAKKQPKRIPAVHPGKILLDEVLAPAGITQYRLAKATGLPPSRITDLIKGRRGITPDSAIRL